MGKELSGLTVSVPLFFQDNESIDFDTLDRYLHDVCQNENVAAIYSMAYNTRYRMLSDSEVYEVNKFIVEKCNSFNKEVYVGHPYSFNKKSLKEYFLKISDLGVSGVSMLYPERYFGDDKIIIEFLKYPNKFGLSTVLHEMKLISGFDGELMDWPLELIDKVFDQVNLVAVKEDSKNDEIARYVLNLCQKNDVSFVLAGGGKRRAQKFFDLGIDTWLNGSTMFAPQLIDVVYTKFMENDEAYIQNYLQLVEEPFFDKVVSRFGWHVSHKAALEYFGYGKRYERFPHPVMQENDYKNCVKVFDEIHEALKRLR